MVKNLLFNLFKNTNFRLSIKTDFFCDKTFLYEDDYENSSNSSFNIDADEDISNEMEEEDMEEDDDEMNEDDIDEDEIDDIEAEEPCSSKNIKTKSKSFYSKEKKKRNQWTKKEIQEVFKWAR